MARRLILISSLFLLGDCTYDASPPEESEINDSKPLLLIDATGFLPQRAVQVQYTDLLGTKTVATAAEKTDSSGRFLYPLHVARGTRSISNLTIIVDQDGSGTFGGGSDKTYGPQTITIISDTEMKGLSLSAATDFTP